MILNLVLRFFHCKKTSFFSSRKKNQERTQHRRIVYTCLYKSKGKACLLCCSQCQSESCIYALHLYVYTHMRGKEKKPRDCERKRRRKERSKNVGKKGVYTYESLACWMKERKVVFNERIYTKPPAANAYTHVGRSSSPSLGTLLYAREPFVFVVYTRGEELRNAICCLLWHSYCPDWLKFAFMLFMDNSSQSILLWLFVISKLNK